MYNVSVITMIHLFDGIIGHNIGHNRSKTVAMPNSIFGRKIGIIRLCLKFNGTVKTADLVIFTANGILILTHSNS